LLNSNDTTMTYVRVARALRASVLAEPTESDGMLPAEPALMERFGVSRGTIRRATDELVREGLLRADRGRGTYILRHAQIRALMKDKLAAIAIPDSRWHLDVLKFVPDFDGSALAHENVKALAEYDAADLLFIAPDNSLTGLITAALTDGKVVLVPTYAMRRGLVILDPEKIAAENYAFASTLDGLERFGRLLGADGLRALPPIDLVVTGAIALTADGVHIGSGEAYLDLEWGLLSTVGLVTPDTPIVGVVHSSQIVDVTLRAKPFDTSVDIVVTEASTRRVSTRAPRPTGLSWAQLTEQQLDTISYLRELRPENFV
jgi:5-formyltetrahydrofolate cyclo-ligase